jgi:N-acetylneuraminic acid mutarotase
MAVVRAWWFGVVALASLVPAMAAADAWRDGAPMTTGRAFAGGALIGSDLYVVGGDSTSGPRSVAEIYDIKGDIWRAAPALPAGLQQLGMAEHGGKLYISGGYEAAPAQRPQFGTFDNPIDEAPAPAGDTSRGWVYDPQVGTWLPIASMPGPRAGHGFVSMGDYIYALGGRGNGTSRVWAYDPGRNEWSSVGDPMPVPRVAAAYVPVDGRIYVIGGLVDGNATGRVDVFDPATGRWQVGPSLPQPRSGHVAALMNGRIHVTGGELRRPSRTFGDHFVLDLASGTWGKAASMPTPRHGAVAAAADGKFVVVGGSPGAGVYTVFTESDVVDIYSRE